MANTSDIVRAVMDADRNLIVLSTLRECGACMANERVLRGVPEALGASTTMDQMRSSLDLLRREGLVATEEVDGTLVVCLTERGEDVVLGRSANEWVAAPRPGGRSRLRSPS